MIGVYRCSTIRMLVTLEIELVYSQSKVESLFRKVDQQRAKLLGATHCNTLQHTATHCNTLQHIATHCNTLQHTATHCNTLQQNN